MNIPKIILKMRILKSKIQIKIVSNKKSNKIIKIRNLEIKKYKKKVQTEKILQDILLNKLENGENYRIMANKKVKKFVAQTRQLLL